MAVKKVIFCPHCGGKIEQFANPVPTVDVIIEVWAQACFQGIVLIERKNPPHGWALPGGFVDYGETVEQAAVREAREETGLEVELIRLLGVYSDPRRDPRQHTLSVVFIGRAGRVPRAGDDARRAKVFTRETQPAKLAFDHTKILADYWQREGKYDRP